MMGLGIRQRSATIWRWLLYRFEPRRWLIKPADVAGKKVCLLASYTATGRVAQHTLALCKAWHRRGYTVVLVVASDHPANVAHDIATAPYLAGVLVRRNIGYDFGSWIHGLAATPGIRHAALLAMTNDSVYGPLDGFDSMLARVDASAADVVGVTDSFERSHHLQSFLIFYRPAALKSQAFRQFWRRTPTGGRMEVIVDGELQLLATMLRHGLQVHTLFPADPAFDRNPTLGLWRRLIANGFPFVKIQLLRDNPTKEDIDGWEILLRDHGYDPALVEHDLGTRFAASAAGLALARTGGTLGGNEPEPVVAS